MLRFVSTLTNDICINDLRLALFNFLAAKQMGEEFIVRIDDLDKNEDSGGKEKEVLEILSLFGIEYSQVIYQSQNIRFYSAMALQLLQDKKAFSCFCSSEWLRKKKNESKKAYRYDDACRNLPAELVIDNTNPFTIRLNRPSTTIVVKDNIKGDIEFKADMLDSFVIMNQDKTPTSNFASAVDDMLNDISLVICNENNLDAISKQEHIRASLNYNKKIEYANIPVVLNDTISVKQLLEDGYLPSTIMDYLITMGNEEKYSRIFSLKDALKYFTLNMSSNSNIYFSLELLKSINKKHLEHLDAVELSRYVGFADEDIGKLAKIYLEEVGTTKELKTKIKPIFEPKNIPIEFKKISINLAKIIKDAPYFEEYQDFKKYIMKKSDLKDDDFVKILRYLLTGSDSGPSIDLVYKYLKNYIGEIVK